MKAIENPFESPDIVLGYEDWYHTAGKSAAHQEKALLKRLLRQVGDVRTALDVGCGTGYFTHWYRRIGLVPLGVDLSMPMIQQAKSDHSLACCLGDAHDLPFLTNSFDLVSCITTLEFVLDPLRVLAEGVRVARQALIMGVINRHSLLGWDYRKKGGPIWDSASFFTPLELMRMVEKCVPTPHKVLYRTTLWPFYSGISKLPWGGFIGMVVFLKP